MKKHNVLKYGHAGVEENVNFLKLNNCTLKGAFFMEETKDKIYAFGRVLYYFFNCASMLLQ